MAESTLKDKYNRKIDYLRVSITDRCNLQCIYCTPRHLLPRLSHEDILTYEEILRFVGVCAGLGVKKIRVTGGEPLVRKGVYEFLGKLTAIKGLADVSLTTNGVFLKDNIDKIKATGIHRINISLDTLKADKYLRITGQDVFHQVWDSIASAQQKGMSPIKLNVVTMKGINDDEIIDFARLSMTQPYYIRFIEYMTIGDANLQITENILTPEIKDRIRILGQLFPVERKGLDGPAEYFKFKGARGRIGFISAISHHFCDTCNRMRLTASGKLRPCLLSDQAIDIKTPMRNGCSDRVLEDIFLSAVRKKPKGHNLTSDLSTRVATQMSSIGG